MLKTNSFQPLTLFGTAQLVVPIFRARGFGLDRFPTHSFGRSLTVVILRAMARYSRADIGRLFPFLTFSINHALTNQVIQRGNYHPSILSGFPVAVRCYCIRHFVLIYARLAWSGLGTQIRLNNNIKTIIIKFSLSLESCGRNIPAEDTPLCVTLALTF